MPFLTDDPIADFYRHEEEQERWLQKLPVCCKCKERIQDDTCYKVNDDIYCDKCNDKLFRVWTEDLME